MYVCIVSFKISISAKKTDVGRNILKHASCVFWTDVCRQTTIDDRYTQQHAVKCLGGTRSSSDMIPFFFRKENHSPLIAGMAKQDSRNGEEQSKTVGIQRAPEFVSASSLL